MIQNVTHPTPTITFAVVPPRLYPAFAELTQRVGESLLREHLRQAPSVAASTALYCVEAMMEALSADDAQAMIDSL